MAMGRNRRLIWVIGIALFCVGFSYGVYQSFRAMHGTPGSERVLPQPESTPGGIDAEDDLDDSHMLDYRTRADVSDQADPSLLEESPGASARDDLSPAEDDSVYYIGIHQNRVAVFEGLPAEGRLFRLTDRPVDSLPPREVASLKTGIRISGEREMLEALEGYMR